MQILFFDNDNHLSQLKEFLFHDSFELMPDYTLIDQANDSLELLNNIDFRQKVFDILRLIFWLHHNPD